MRWTQLIPGLSSQSGTWRSRRRFRRCRSRRRLVVFLHYFADLPYEAIAEALEIEAGTVAATLAQARQALAAILIKEGVRP